MTDRDERGRFIKGNTAATGRRRKVEEEQIKAALQKAIPEPDVLAKLAEAIRRRESWAISLYLAYKWGQPVKRQEVTGPEGAELVIRYVNDWRDYPSLPTSGSAGGAPPGSPLQLAGGGEALEKNDADDGDSG